MEAANPFTQTRFEYEGTHLYYLPAEVMKRLEEPKPAYLIGTRGTGKTTLLKALSWDERLTNKSLRLALNNRPFQKCFIGVYFKLAERVSYHFTKWSADSGMEELVLGLYIDLLWLEELTRAIATLMIQKGAPRFHVKPDDETKLVKHVMGQYPELKQWEMSSAVSTLAGLSDFFRLMRRTLQQASMDKLDVREVMRQYPPNDQIGDFGRTIASILAEFCDRSTRNTARDEEQQRETRRWYFKVCIDEAEWFSKEQNRIINTIVRLSQWPTFFLVSYVRDRHNTGDMSSTLSKAITLSDADRPIIWLDNITELDRGFFEGVATIRVRTALKETSPNVDIHKILGKLDINALLKLIIDESKSPAAQQWIRKARELQKTAFWSQRPRAKRDSSETGSLPIYQAYIIHRLGRSSLLQISPEQKEAWAHCGSEWSKIRKRMVVAYLCLCRELDRREVPYASATMLEQMSDNCIRDFLNQINEIYVESKLDLKEFLKREVAVKTQHAALCRASSNKLDNLPRSRAPNPLELGRVVRGLGYITKRLQSDIRRNYGLRSEERGRFVLNFNPDKESEDQRVRECIEQGIENGYLYLVSDKGSALIIRLHCSLAAYFKFSYRGAYTNTYGLEPSDIVKLMDAKEVDVDDVAQSITDRLITGDCQPSLYESE